MSKADEIVDISTLAGALAPLLTRADAGAFQDVMPGEAMRCLIPSAATGGTFSLFEVMTHPGGGNPPHIHTREDESFYVLEGTLQVNLIGGEPLILNAGDAAFGPRNVPHNLYNPGDVPVRFLMLCTPGTLDPFFAAMNQTSAPLTPGGPPNIPAIIALCAEYGIEILPPPAQ